MIIAHIDMDCFFCSCEIKHNPKLKGVPLVVGATGNRGVVCAASYEARAFGVASATPISRARQLCSHAIFLPTRGKLYHFESQKIMGILRSIADDMQQVSIDEAYLDITSLAAQFDSLERCGVYIQALIKKRTKLPCSIGISQSRTISKIASDFNKPFGVTVVEDIPTFMQQLPIEKYPGIGKVSTKRFHRYNIYKIGQIMKMDRFKLLELFGMYGVRIQQVSTGEILKGLSKRGKRKSISCENTFHNDESDHSKVKDRLKNLCTRVHTHLKERAFKTVSIKVRFSDFTTITRDFTLKNPDCSLERIEKSAFGLFEHAVENEAAIRLVGVKLSNLLHDTARQTTLSSF